jgi:endonuclease III
MSNAKKLKVSDRQAIAQKVLGVIKKHYKGVPPKIDHATLETLLFAALLENAPYAPAEEAFDRLLAAFHDLNEIRVSSITEIEHALAPLPDSGMKAVRVREVLQYTFEKYFSFDLEQLRRKTSDLVDKQLTKIRHLTPFMKSFLHQHALGSHSVPIDERSREVLAWLGLIEAGATIDAASEDLRHVIRKADTDAFCFALRGLATDTVYKGRFRVSANSEPDATTAAERLTQLINSPGAKPAKIVTTKKPEPAAAPPKRPSKPTPKAAPPTKKVTKAKPTAKKK